MSSSAIVMRPKSLPSRERGLKFTRMMIGLIFSMSLPSRERGLKYYARLAESGL